MIELVAVLMKRVAEMRGRIEVFLVEISEPPRDLIPELFFGPLPVEFPGWIPAGGGSLPNSIHGRAYGHGYGTNIAGVHQKIPGCSRFRIAADLGEGAFHRNHFRKLVRAPIHHRHMIIDALAGGDFAVILQITVSVVGPNDGNLGRNLQVALLDEFCSFLPQIGNKLRIRMHRANNLHLVGNGFTDKRRQCLVVVANVGIHGSVGHVGKTAQANGPEHFLIRPVRSYGVFPRAFQNLRMLGIVVGNVLGPASNIKTKGNRVMLGNNQTSFGGQPHLRVVGENPGPWSDHVPLQTQNGFKDSVPHLQRNSGFVFLFSRRPSGQEIFVIDEKSAIGKDGWWVGFIQ